MKPYSRLEKIYVRIHGYTTSSYTYEDVNDEDYDYYGEFDFDFDDYCPCNQCIGYVGVHGPVFILEEYLGCTNLQISREDALRILQDNNQKRKFMLLKSF